MTGRVSIIALGTLIGLALGACGAQPPTTTTPTGAAGSPAPATATADLGTTATAETGTTATTGLETTATAETGTTATTGLEATATAETGTTATTGLEATATAETGATATAGSGTRATAGADTAATAGTAAASSTILDVAEQQGQFSTLLAAVDAAGLSKTLEGSGPYTVFAPTDAAFEQLPSETIEALLQDQQTLSKVLSYHVAQGELASSDVTQANTITTVEGSPISVSASGNTVLLNNDAQIVTKDIQTSNGVIHVIDKVLLPPDVQLPAS